MENYSTVPISFKAEKCYSFVINMKLINLFLVVACIVASAMATPGNSNAQGVLNTGFFNQGGIGKK
ncbi:hypothetical protein FF38_13612 [Lucilia cuprina]|uniref:Uncharacterized protein n=1 Tax=Lucilia cuprina TaxID=7375 RepID=A0A0L0C9P7_LUCCU|nr:hypothetical protein CVS40_12296 [Lucilia cuprina]KNC29158.1 hypothetical protein FF38_13612 [Lucilia cuprina]